MTSSGTVPQKAAASGETSLLPATIVSLCLLGLTMLSSPALLEHFVRLDWKAGDVRPLVRGLQLGLGVLTLGSWWLRRGVTRVYRRSLPTPKHLLFAFLGVSLSLAFTLLAIEAIMRWVDFPFSTSWTPPEFARAQFDPEVGWVYIPNWSGVQNLKVGGEQRAVPMHFSEIGARVRSPAARHDAHAPTVLLVGCSFTAGYGVPYEETFAGQLEAQPNFPLQVVNLGVEAYGTDQALLLLRRHFDKFNTQVVIYTFIADHVPRNENYDRRLLFRGARFVGTKPLFDLDGSQHLYLRKPPRRYEDLSYSRLGATLEFAWSHWGPKPTLDLTRALVQEMKRYVEARGGTFIVVAWDWDWVYLAPRDQWPPFRDIGVNLIDAAVDAPDDWGRWRIPGDSHPNAQAHGRIARLIREDLTRRGLVPAAPATQP